MEHKTQGMNESNELEKEIVACGPQLINYFRAKGCNEADAEDMTQTVMQRAIKGQKDFNGKSKTYTWLYPIARNLMIDKWRKEGKYKQIPMGLFKYDAEDGMLSPEQIHRLGNLEVGYIPTDIVTSLEDNKVVRDLVKKLDEKHREVIEDRFFEGLSYEQIAERRHIKSGLVGSRIHYALKELAELIKSHPHFN